MGFFKNLFKKKTAPTAPQIPEEVAEKVAQHFDEGVMPEECRVRPFSARSYARYLEALRVREAAHKANSEPESLPAYMPGIGKFAISNPEYVKQDDIFSPSMLPWLTVVAAVESAITPPDDTLTGQGGSFDGAGASGDWDSSATGSTE